MATLKTPRDSIILALIRMFHEQDDCDPSYLDLICEGELSPNTVSRVLRNLEYRGILSIRRGRGCVRNEYRINGGQREGL
jgi:DNA-binding transcriptional regulator YhcF (GntR family)